MRSKYRVFYLLILLIFTSLVEAQQSEIFIFPHTIGRLFNFPTSRTLRSGDIQANLGSNFNDAGIENFSGNITAGLFNFSELQLSSSNSDISIFDYKNELFQAGIKFSVLAESVNFPGLAVGAKIQLGWNKNIFDASFLNNNAGDKFNSGLREVQFKQRKNLFYTVLSKRLFSTFNLHIGFRLYQLFIDEFTTAFDYGKNTYYNGKIKNNLTEFAGGFNFVLNGRTKFMIEIFSAPNFNINTETGMLSINRKTLINAGMRTFMNEWFVIDYGLHYDDQYNKLENIQLRVGLSAFWNVKN